MKHTTDLQFRLFAWWRENGRVLPWRVKEKNKVFESEFSKSQKDLKFPTQILSIREEAFYSYFDTSTYRDPYRVVVSEIMLQQTQVDRVKEKYKTWMEKWPRIEDLAKASLSEVIIEWKGLGYNRRARFLWLLAKEIVENRAGEWPKTEKELLKLPGIGRYTARAVMSFSLGKQVGVIDTNVKRIFERVLQPELLKPDEFFQLADELLPLNLADPWNQALMDFGALICTAKNPKCDICPINELCAVNILAKKEGFENFKMKLATMEKVSKVPKKSKDYAKGKAIKFEETDRFLRGRTLDLLREKELNREVLINILNTKFTQFKPGRIEQNISKLVNEGMIEEKDGVVKLGT